MKKIYFYFTVFTLLSLILSDGAFAETVFSNCVTVKVGNPKGTPVLPNSCDSSEGGGGGEGGRITNCNGYSYTYPFQDLKAATYGKKHHNYSAIDMMCPYGKVLVAVTNGYITHNNRNTYDRSCGPCKDYISVYLHGNDGYIYYYTHLDKRENIPSGSKVTVGQVLGTCGSSGNSAASAPHLHFGISKGEQKKGFYPSRVYNSAYAQLSPWKTVSAWKEGRCPAYPGE